MNKAEAKKCIYLLASLWTNYKPPQDELTLETQTTAWISMFGSVQFADVQNTILSIAAEGVEFAPQIGQVYARLKERRLEKKLALEKPKIDPELFGLCACYAKVANVDIPSVMDSNEDIVRWFRKTREKVRAET